MSLNVFKYLFDGRDGQNEDKRESSGVSSGWGDIWYLLHKCYEEEEYVGVAVELLEQEFRNKCGKVVLCCCYLIVTELMPSIYVQQSHGTGATPAPDRTTAVVV